MLAARLRIRDGQAFTSASDIPPMLSPVCGAEHADLGDTSQHALCSFNLLGAYSRRSPIPTFLPIPSGYMVDGQPCSTRAWLYLS